VQVPDADARVTSCHHGALGSSQGASFQQTKTGRYPSVLLSEKSQWIAKSNPARLPMRAVSFALPWRRRWWRTSMQWGFAALLANITIFFLSASEARWTDLSKDSASSVQALAKRFRRSQQNGA